MSTPRTLKLKDNLFQGKEFPKDFEGGSSLGDLSKNEWDLLLRYSGKTLEDLRKAHVVVLGSSAGSKNPDFFYCISDIGEKNENGVPRSFKIKTGNLMGVLCLRDEEGSAIKIQIHSRFDDENRHFFLTYLLQKVFSGDFVPSTPSAVEGGLDFLLAAGFLFQLRRAATVGSYKQYCRFFCNDLNFKGRLDLSRHLKVNVPLWDKIAYTKREISFDNPLNNLFRSAIHRIERKWGHLFLLREHDVRIAVNALKQNTPSWNSHKTHSVLMHKDSLCPMKHPLFAEFYEPLRKLARMLLLEEASNMFHDSEMHEVAGVVFDGAWLWEEYLATLLVPRGFAHCQRGVMKSDMLHCFKVRKGPLYPDFLWRDGKVVLDAKYKRGDSDDRTDRHQVLCYMFLSGAKQGGLIYPPACPGEIIDEEDGRPTNGWSEPRKVDTPFPECFWSCFRFESIASEDDFRKCMEAQEKKLLEGPKQTPFPKSQCSRRNCPVSDSRHDANP